MPKGVYPRTANQRLAAVANLAKGRSPEARQKAAESLREIALDPAWREKVSAATRTAMHRPEVRQRHMDSMRAAKVNFAGGNGQTPARTVREAALILEPLGYMREYVIKTSGHGTGLNCPMNYKADFAHPQQKVAIELDGPCHRPLAKQALDKKKTTVLEALGWTVHRIRH